MDVDTAQPPESQMRGWVIGLIQLVFVIGVIGGAVGLSQALKAQVGDRAPQIADMREAATISIRLADLETLDYVPTLRANGTVQTTAEVSVSPQVSGEIKRVSAQFRPGSEIQKGSLLFEIDRADYLLAVERAEAEIASANSDLQQLEAEARLAIQEWEELFPGREVNELAARVPQIEAANARLGSAIANKKTAELSLQRTRVYAPVNARVLASTLDIGQIVSPGQVVGRLVASDSIEIAVPLSRDELAVIDPAIGRSMAFARRDEGGPVSSATVVRVDASLDARTRLSNLYATPDVETGFRIGDFVDVTIQSDSVPGAIALPSTALTGQSDLWVLEDNALSPRTITILGERDEGRIVIAAPFDTADGVVALPPLDAEPGQVVSVRNVERSASVAGGASNGAQ